jgi:hypothetical protein
MKMAGKIEERIPVGRKETSKVDKITQSLRAMIAAG